MQSIFDPSLSFREQRGSGLIAPDPFGTGRVCAGAASRKALWGPTHGASRSWLRRKSAPARSAP